MRTGASVARIVWNLKKRRIKRKARRGSRIAWGKGEVKRDICCQTEKAIGVLVQVKIKDSRPQRATYVDISTTGTGSVCLDTPQALLEIMVAGNLGGDLGGSGGPLHR